MASGREGDTSLWLHNKLGTSNDTWVGGSICSQYNAEVLSNIRGCFLYLQPQVKLKLLLSFFHLSRRSADDWHSELEEILELGRVDSDPWVAMVAEIMMPFPSTGCLSEEYNSSELSGQIFHTLLDDIREIVKEKCEGSSLLPLEAQFLNPNALQQQYGTPPVILPHFKLKRKPKAAALRVELLNKSVEAANHIKKHPMPTVPVRSRGMPRKLTDTTPLKGIPNRIAGNFGRSISGFSSFGRSSGATRSLAGPKEGGIKLLDINEQPLGLNPGGPKAKKVKKGQDTEEKLTASTSAAGPNETLKTQITPEAKTAELCAQNEDASHTNPSYVPIETLGPVSPPRDASCGTSPPAMPAAAAPVKSVVITATAIPTPPPPMSADMATSPQQQDYQESSSMTEADRIRRQVSENLAILTDRKPVIHQAVLQSPVQAPQQPVFGIPAQIQPQLQQPQTATARIFYQTKPLIRPSKESPLGQEMRQQPAPLTYATLQPLQTIGTGATVIAAVPSGASTSQLHQMQVRPQQLQVQLQNQQLGQQHVAILPAQLLQGGTMRTLQIQTGTTIITAPAPQPHQTQVQVQQPQPPQQQQIPQVTAQIIPQPAQPKKGLSLTREQMAEAQEMFRTANRVTRPEKALILGFMAGSRDNPCPHLGNIVTIKLSEEEERVRQPNGTIVPVSVETLFQMNYNTGEWRRLRKQRTLPAVQ